ncbi:5-(carboxyamino)imidazole ribonucleotide synthase [Granulicella mallensis]|uniref:N5-carboxyaminoimidazole ribonucleotide synthase n=1 Tax=Granulicella mallensis (strain ATCC BAA-1857 / DSM 23137 / MP5ACTX8) TaxID=682795 RepID=G8NYF7_GRAMM|nr:5-(carboxyamino)imidazole ribonucleotide synthase [Granulicella mallensis]AEU37923.1 phosphoribosylaminoimidazole carboxylase, ATPase subunit [Granulicella mallensis MP5ACTX8]
MTQTARTRIGILGAGQLALMLAEAGRRLDVDIICAGQPGDCAEQVAPVVAVDLDDAAAVAAFAAQVDLVTIESENIDATVLHGLNLYPNARAVGIAQDRLPEKSFFQVCGIGTAPFAPVDSLQDLERAIVSTGLPAILKTRRMGYDGKGQVRLHRPEDAAAAWEEIGRVSCILEGMLRFDAEVSLIAARGRTGQIVFYPLIENHHRDGILRTSIAPYAHASTLQAQAEAYMTKILEELDYVGVLAIEFFVQGDTLRANEMAPRVHNSGHWTIEGSKTSQFENHLRAIAGMELGSTESRPTVMLNCIGMMPSVEETAQFPVLFRHDYGKESRPGRKVGHLTCAASETTVIAEWQRRLGQI